MSDPVLKENELDALTEVCNIGMAHAATALSQMMGKGVGIEVPRLQLLDPAGLSVLLDAEAMIGLKLQILGQVRGSILILLGRENAHRMLQLLLGRQREEGAPLSDLEVSTLNEVGNILASACLNALGTMLKMTLLPSVPTLVAGGADGLLQQVLGPHGNGEAVVMIDTMFTIAHTACSGSMFLIPESASLHAILGALERP